MKVRGLEGAELDYWVAKAEGMFCQIVQRPHGPVCEAAKDMNDADVPPERYAIAFQPSMDWDHGGPIIERERIHLYHDKEDGFWMADIERDGIEYSGSSERPLVAAMRAYVASKFGYEVEETP